MVDEMKKIRSALARVNETKLKAYSDKDKVLIMIQDAPEELRRLANALEKINVTEIAKAWLSGEPNYGFRLSAPGLGAQWQRYTITWKSYESKPYDPAANPDGPRLVIHQLPK